MSARTCPQCGRQYPPDTRFCPDDGAALRARRAGDDLVGETIAERYHVIRKLGEGGMGQVYLAEHVRMKRKSALKVMRPGMMHDADAIARFNREAENASQIIHPHVAAIYDFGETPDGLIYLAMEYVEGEPLSRLIDRHGSLPPARAAEIIHQTADALTAAHDLGIVHRDLKPDNIMIAKYRDGSDCVKVVDFGIAKVTHGSGQTVTRTGLAIGTPEYMSPEQLGGGTVDARSDIYALGIVTFHILTGDLPFPPVTSAESLIARLTKRPLALGEVRRAVSWPPALQAVLDRALDGSPATRFQSAAEMGRALLDAVRAGPAPQTTGDAAGGQPVATPTPQSPMVPLPVTSAAARRPSADTEPMRPGQGLAPAAAAPLVTPTDPLYEAPPPPPPPARHTPTAPRLEPRPAAPAASVTAEAAAAAAPEAAGAEAREAAAPAPEPPLSITREGEALFGRRRSRGLYGFLGLGTVAAALFFTLTRGDQLGAPPSAAVTTPPRTPDSAGATPAVGAPSTAAPAAPGAAGAPAIPAESTSRRPATRPADSLPASGERSPAGTKTGAGSAGGGTTATGTAATGTTSPSTPARPAPQPPAFSPESGRGTPLRRVATAESVKADPGTAAERPAGGAPVTPPSSPAAPAPASAALRWVAAGGDRSCGLLASGALACWGDGKTSPGELPGGALSRVSVGGSHACGLRDGTVYCWGGNGAGQLGVGSRAPHATPTAVAGGVRFKEVSAGGSHSCAIAEDGRAYCWGSNSRGQLGTGNRGDQLAPALVKSRLVFTSISSGLRHSCALASDRTAHCWGDGFSGALGRGVKQNEYEPTPVSADPDHRFFVRLVTGQEHSCALEAGGKIYCWGGNTAGQLGDGTNFDRLRPVLVSAPLEIFTALAAGDEHSCALTDEGVAYCWGSNFSGQLGVPGGNRRTPVRAVDQPLDGIAAGRAHSCGIARGQQTAFCWGDNHKGQLGDGTTASRANAAAVRQ